MVDYEGITIYDCINYHPPIKEGKVVKVYDGDTITIASKIGDKFYKFSVRIRGVDCPEIRGGDEIEKKAALIVRDKLSELIMNKVVTLEDIDYDKYGRILAKIKYDTTDLEIWLLTNKYAVPYDGGRKYSPENWLYYMQLN